MDHWTMPTGAYDRASDIPFDGTKQRCDHGRLKFSDHSRNRFFAGSANGAPRFQIETVNGFSTQIDQITSSALKDCQKVFVVD
jgi:hypothetical protein